MRMDGVPIYTPVGGVLNATAFEQWLVAHSTNASTLVLTPGRYRVPALSGGLAHVPLTQPLADTLVDMTGVTLVMESRVSTALRVSNWQRCTLRGLTIEYERLPTNQAVIRSIAADGKSFDVDVPTGYPLDDWRAASNGRLRFSTTPQRRLLMDGADVAATTARAFSCNVYVGTSRFL